MPEGQILIEFTEDGPYVIGYLVLGEHHYELVGIRRKFEANDGRSDESNSERDLIRG